MKSTPGDLFFGRFLIMDCTTPGIVKILKRITFSQFCDISEMSGPGFVVNCHWRKPASSSDLSMAENTKPFGPISGWEGCLYGLQSRETSPIGLVCVG